MATSKMLKDFRELMSAVRWLIDDIADAGEDHNVETGVEYDSNKFARETLEKMEKKYAKKVKK